MTQLDPDLTPKWLQDLKVAVFDPPDALERLDYKAGVLITQLQKALNQALLLQKDIDAVRTASVAKDIGEKNNDR